MTYVEYFKSNFTIYIFIFLGFTKFRKSRKDIRWTIWWTCP